MKNTIIAFLILFCLYKIVPKQTVNKKPWLIQQEVKKQVSYLKTIK